VKNVWIGTGWKMNHTLDDSIEYADVLKLYSRNIPKDFNVFILPPFISLAKVKELLNESQIIVGAQNMHWEESGSFTGEISPLMLRSIGINLVEIGHSERRSFFNETDLMINQKVKAAIFNSLKPLICFGETKEIKDSGAALDYVCYQVKTALSNLETNEIKNVMLAYEPVWAIGENGEAASTDYAEYIIGGIRQSLKTQFGEKISENVPILYGGSVNINNAVDFVKMPSISGLFIGRAAWLVEDFIKLIEKIASS
jgi:triosephosphate isomerase